MQGEPLRRLLQVEVRVEQDVVLARQRARQLGSALGFEHQDQIRIATAVSEIARNAFQYGGGGKVVFGLAGGPPALVIEVSDRGRGIPNLGEVLGGKYVSRTGMGIGLLGAKRLMDGFDIETGNGRGTTVTLTKHLPRGAAPASPEQLSRELARYAAQNPLEEVRQQNQELLRTLDELRQRQSDLSRLNVELEDTNRGVVALYAELDERADYLRRASEIKSKFLSNMTHEFRTPLNSILSLTQILLDRMDGDLAPEQEKQVRFIRKAAEDLSELVNDLLDLAKVEAGRVTVRAGEFDVADLFGALRGMLRPLLPPNCPVVLIFDEPQGLPQMNTDEGKVSQILRNFISNALKFTEKGEVRVSAKALANGTIEFAVADTGIGVAPEDEARIFEEYAQVDSPQQRRSKGTGLGLPLSRRLAELLGGRIALESRPGEGSTFTLTIPPEYKGKGEASLVPDVQRQLDPSRQPVLVLEDNRETLFIYEKFLKGTGFQVVPARTIREAREALAAVVPAAIIMDILLEGENSWDLLLELKEREDTKSIPVIVATVVDNQQKANSLGADAFCIKPVERSWLLAQLEALTSGGHLETALVIDDDEVSRYLLRGLLSDTRYSLTEAPDPRYGLELARSLHPRVIFLDMVMPTMSGLEVLTRLKADPATQNIPVVMYTSKLLTPAEREQLAAAAVILPKENVSRGVAMARLRDALTLVEAQRKRAESEGQRV